RTFYPLSDGSSIQNRRITIPVFPPCSACRPYSQAPLCYCTPRTVTKRTEGTFGSLRYPFGGDHPSQTTHQAMSPYTGVRYQTNKGWYFNSDSTNPGEPASMSPTYPTHHLSSTNTKLQ